MMNQMKRFPVGTKKRVVRLINEVSAARRSIRWSALAMLESKMVTIARNLR